MTDLALRLDQRGRASVDFIGLLGQANNRLREQFPGIAAGAGIDAAALADDLDDRAAQLAPVMAAAPAFQVQQLLGEYHARQHGPIATEAFERIAASIAPASAGATTLALDPELVAPDYWQGVDFHRTAGGWDGHPQAGHIHAEIVHRKMVEKIFPGGIFRQRRATAALAPRDDYAAILEMGCSTGHYTTALAEAYPDAAITGIDLSARGLEHCTRAGNARGAAWTLAQRPAEATGFADASFDLVTSYILLHELPAAMVIAVFAEAFRVLRPGGDMLMADVTRFADMERLMVWRQDLLARMGGEPFWRETASLDLAALAQAAGFTAVSAIGHYPHVTQGRKPLG